MASQVLSILIGFHLLNIRMADNEQSKNLKWKCLYHIRPKRIDKAYQNTPCFGTSRVHLGNFGSGLKPGIAVPRQSSPDADETRHFDGVGIVSPESGSDFGESCNGLGIPAIRLDVFEVQVEDGERFPELGRLRPRVNSTTEKKPEILWKCLMAGLCCYL